MRKIRASLAASALAAVLAASPAQASINNGNLVIIGTGAAAAGDEPERVNNGNLIQAASSDASGDKAAFAVLVPGSLQGWWWLLSLAQLSAQ